MTKELMVELHTIAVNFFNKQSEKNKVHDTKQHQQNPGNHYMMPARQSNDKSIEM